MKPSLVSRHKFTRGYVFHEEAVRYTFSELYLKKKKNLETTCTQNEPSQNSKNGSNIKKKVWEDL